MLVFRNKVDIKINYPIENFSKKEKIIYFDIETTGFSRKYCIVYLIGCMYYSGDELCYTQWLAENFNDEANVLMAFNKFIKDFDTVIHFNGNSFDIPFVTERGKKYNLEFDFDNYQSIDIYKPVSKLNHILKMENNKQKSFEKLLGINRSDPFSGGDLIEVFKHYVESKDERLLFPLLLHNNVREYLDDAAIVHLVQGFFSHPLHGLVDTERSDAICGIKIEIFRGQTYDFALPQCAHQCEVNCQMQDGVLHAVQSRSHFLYCPNGALLRGLLGAVHGNRTFDKNAPLYGILEGCTQQPVHLMDGGAGKEPLLLLFGQFLLLSLDIRTAGRFAQGRIEVLHVVGLEFLHFHAADIRDNQVLDGGKVGFVGFGRPLVLAALLGQPIHQELCHRHGGWNQESTSRQFMLDLLFSVCCLLFGGKTLPFVAALAVLIFISVSDAIRVAALRNICHTVCLLIKLPG